VGGPPARLGVWSLGWDGRTHALAGHRRPCSRSPEHLACRRHGTGSCARRSPGGSAWRGVPPLGPRARRCRTRRGSGPVRRHDHSHPSCTRRAPAQATAARPATGECSRGLPTIAADASALEPVLELMLGDTQGSATVTGEPDCGDRALVDLAPDAELEPLGGLSDCEAGRLSTHDHSWKKLTGRSVRPPEKSPVAGFLDAPREIRTPTTQMGHKALNLAYPVSVGSDSPWLCAFRCSEIVSVSLSSVPETVPEKARSAISPSWAEGA
jgi:hypothetical protein